MGKAVLAALFLLTIVGCIMAPSANSYYFPYSRRSEPASYRNRTRNYYNRNDLRPSPFEGIRLSSLEPEPIVEPVQILEPKPTHETHILVYRVQMVLKACSPQDPHDSRYYNKHGFKGAAYNLCTHFTVIPEGALIRLPEEAEYMNVSYPGKWWTVDASIGQWGRDYGTGSGEVWADVKYRTHYSSKRYGTKHVVAEVILPAGKTPSRVLQKNLVDTYWLPRDN